MFKETKPDVYFPFLAGVYKEHAGSGFGVYVIQKIVEEAVIRGAKGVETCVSSNNTPIVKIHLQLGFALEDLKYIYIKHQ